MPQQSLTIRLHTLRFNTFLRLIDFSEEIPLVPETLKRFLFQQVLNSLVALDYEQLRLSGHSKSESLLMVRERLLQLELKVTSRFQSQER